METAQTIKKSFKKFGISNIIPIFVFSFPEYADRKMEVSNVLQGRKKDEKITSKLNTLKSIYEFNRAKGEYQEKLGR